MFVKLKILVIFLEFISVFILIVFFNEIFTPINHKHSFKELINWFWYLRYVCDVAKIDASLNYWWKFSTLKYDSWIINEESFVHADKIIDKKLIIFNVIFTVQMSVSYLTKILIKRSEVINSWLILVKYCYCHLQYINIWTNGIFVISLEYCIKQIIQKWSKVLTKTSHHKFHQLYSSLNSRIFIILDIFWFT